MHAYKSAVKAVVLGAMLSLAWCGLAAAQTEHDRPCAEDAKKFCKDVPPGGGRLAQCMKQHESEWSAACKAHHAAMRQDMEKIHQACKGDVETLCKDIKPGGGRIARCLKENDAQVSGACKNAAQDARAKRQEPKEKKPRGDEPRDRSPGQSR